MFKNVTSKIKVKTIWFITYLSVLLLPFIVCSYNYLQTYGIIKNEINTNNFTLLQQIQNVVDSNISDFNKISLNLQLNDRVKSISYAENPLDSNRLYQLLELKQDITSFKTANVSIGDIIVHFRKSDLVVNTRTTYTMGLADAIESENIRSKDWKEIYRILTDAGYRLGGKPEFSVPFLARSLVSFDNENILSTAVITFNEEFLIQNLKNSLPDKNANICIVDDKNHVLVSTDYSITDKMDFTNSIEVTKPVTIKDLDNNKHVVSTIKSKVSNWRYVYIVPNSIYNQKLVHVSNLILLNLSICVILGLFIIYGYSKLNYRPVEKILSYVKQYNNEDVAKINEFNIILKTLENNHTEMSELQRVLRNSTLLKILNGEVKLSIINNTTLEKLQFCFLSEKFIVVIFRINKTGHVFAKDEVQALYPNLSLLKFAISNVFEELAADMYHCNFCEAESAVICILNPRDEGIGEDTHKQNIIGLLSSTLSFFSQKFDSVLTAGFSRGVKGADNLSFAYSEARDACEYIEIFEEDIICCYDDIDNSSILNESISDESSYLIKMIMSGRMDEVKECLNTNFNHILCGNKSLFEVKYFMSYFYRISLRLKNMLVQKYGIDYPKAIDNIHVIFSKPSLKKVSGLIEEMYISVCRFVIENKNKSTMSISQNVCQYIENNYIDGNLNVNNIASYFDFTPAYLSKKFKEDIGESIVDYIYKVRIKQAKHLIVQSNLKVADIATMIGFVDSNAFIRIFKRLEGVTPGAFKELKS